MCPCLSRQHCAQSALRKLARHCIDRAKDTGASEYRIDVVPSAVGFWAKLGFVEEEPDAEQEFYMDKGGDRPMSLKL